MSHYLTPQAKLSELDKRSELKETTQGARFVPSDLQLTLLIEKKMGQKRK
jgi:hypothetical protein